MASPVIKVQPASGAFELSYLSFEGAKPFSLKVLPGKKTSDVRSLKFLSRLPRVDNFHPNQHLLTTITMDEKVDS